MVLFFGNEEKIYAVDVADGALSAAEIERLEWLFSGAGRIESESIEGSFIGPRREMITPWSTNAVEITQNMGVGGIRRIEEFTKIEEEIAPGQFRVAKSAATVVADPMLNRRYNGLGQDVFTITRQPEPIREVCDIAAYNRQEGLALSDDEVAYLEGVSAKMGRPLTDSAH